MNDNGKRIICDAILHDTHGCLLCNLTLLIVQFPVDANNMNAVI